MSTESFREFIEQPDPAQRVYSDLELIQLYQQNPDIRVDDIMRMTGRNIAEFYRTLRRYNVSPSRLKTNHHLVVSYATQGYKVAEIAELTGYTARNVRYIMRSYKDLID